MIEVVFGPIGGMADIDGALLFPVTLQGVVDEWFDGVRRGNDGAWYPIIRAGRQTFIIWHDGDAVFQTHEMPVVAKRDDGTTTYAWGATSSGSCSDQGEATMSHWKYVHARKVVLALCEQLGIDISTVAEVVITLGPQAPVRATVHVFVAEDAGQAIIDLFGQPEIEVKIE